MSEERYIVFPNNVVWDNQLDEVVCRCILEGIGDAENVCQRLNEQQALINALKKENKELKEDLKKGFDVPIPYVENSMRRLRAEHKVDEQQATIIELQEIIIDLKDDKNQLHKVISKLRQEVAELKTRNAVLSSHLHRIPPKIREVWLE